jgi:hypothetical protein
MLKRRGLHSFGLGRKTLLDPYKKDKNFLYFINAETSLADSLFNPEKYFCPFALGDYLF